MLKPLFTLFFSVALMPFWLSAGEHSHAEHIETGDIKSEIKEDIKHHLLDSYDFHLLTDKSTGKHYGFPLPVILWDGGLHVFSSSKFHHGTDVHSINDVSYFPYNSKIYAIDNGGLIHLAKTRKEIQVKENGKKETQYFTDTIESLSFDAFKTKYIESHHAMPEGVFIANQKPLDFSITKNVAMIFLISLLVLLIFRGVARSYQRGNGLPKGIGRILEPIVLYVRDDIAIPNIGKKHYKRYMSFLLTVFFFVWTVNLFGLTPLGVNVTNNIAVTFFLAILTYLITTFTAKKDYWLHLVDPLGNSMPWVAKIPLYLLLVPIEFLGTIIKPFSLMIRLYANITAGHIVMMSLIGMMFVFNNWVGSSLSFLLAFVLSILELLVAALQAYIFTMLSAVYFGSAVQEHSEEHH